MPESHAAQHAVSEHEQPELVRRDPRGAHHESAAEAHGAREHGASAALPARATRRTPPPKAPRKTIAQLKTQPMVDSFQSSGADAVPPTSCDIGILKTENAYTCPMHRWIASAAGGTRQRLNPGFAMDRSRSRNERIATRQRYAAPAVSATTPRCAFPLEFPLAFGRVAQLVRALVSHTRGRGFDPLRAHKYKLQAGGWRLKPAVHNSSGHPSRSGRFVQWATPPVDAGSGS